MVTEIAPITFQYSHTIGRQESRGGNGFFNPVSVARGPGERLYVLSRGTETPAFFPCKRVTICSIDEEYIGEFGEKVGPEDAVPTAHDGAFFWPTAVALDSSGNAYVADEWLNRISVFTQDGDWVMKWGIPGDGDGEIDRPSGLAFDKDDNLYLVDSRNHRVQVFTKDGQFIRKWGTHGDADGQFSFPWGIDIDRNGDVFVADWRNDRIQKFTAEGQFLMKIGSSGDAAGEFNRPTDVAVDQDGNIYVADYKNDRLQVFEGDGRFVTEIEGQATLSKWGRERVELDPTIQNARHRARNLEEREGPFQGPISVDVDAKGRIFVAEVPRHRVQVFLKQSPLFTGDQL